LLTLVGLATFLLQPLPAYASHAIGGDYHWSDGSQPRAFVTIADFTPSGWPVNAATSTWGTEPNIDVYYTFGGCGGTGHCVDVRLKNMAQTCNNTRGVTTVYRDNGHYTADTIVRFNDACSSSQFTNTNRRSVACHELGHVMGLDEDLTHTIQESCMVQVGSNWVNRTAFPGDHDFYALHNTVYDHND
jgi:hypothetical protein